MRIIISIVLLMVALALGAIGFALIMGGVQSDRVEAELGDRRFSYKADYARDPATGVGGRADRLAFAVAFPKFAPVAPASASMSAKALTARNRSTVFITLAAADGMEPSERPAQLYSRFFEGDATAGPGGLIVRQFEAASPYEGERLLLAPPDGRLFFARCPSDVRAFDENIESCLFVFRTKALDVELRFAPSLVEHWETLLDSARRFLASIEVVRKKN
jgi:hypothetical protein